MRLFAFMIEVSNHSLKGKFMRLALSILLLLGLSGSVHAQTASRSSMKKTAKTPTWGTLKPIEYNGPTNAYEKFRRNQFAIDPRNPYAWYSDEAIANEKWLKAEAAKIERTPPKRK